jgi:hypothetical protein
MKKIVLAQRGQERKGNTFHSSFALFASLREKSSFVFSFENCGSQSLSPLLYPPRRGEGWVQSLPPLTGEGWIGVSRCSGKALEFHPLEASVS